MAARKRLWALCALLSGLGVASTGRSSPSIPIAQIPKDAPPNVKSAIAELYSMDPVVRGTAPGRLVSLGDPAVVAVPFLAAMLHDDYPLRWAVTFVEDPYEPFKARMDREEKTNPGREAARALVKLRGPAPQLLLDALKDDRLAVLRNAASALGSLKETRAVPLLIPLLKTEDLAARCKVPYLVLLDLLKEEELRKLKPEEVQQLRDAMVAQAKLEDSETVLARVAWNLRPDEAKRLKGGRIGSLPIEEREKVKDELVKILKEEVISTQCEIARALGSINDPAAVEALIALLRDPRWEIRPGDPENHTKLARNGEWKLRREAVWALGVIGDPRAIESLIARLGDRVEVRKEAELALMAIRGPGALEPAIEKLKDKDPAVRRIAAKLLGKIRDRRAVPALIDGLRDDAPDVQFEVLSTLRLLSGQDYPPVPAKWQRWWEIEQAAEALKTTAESVVETCLTALRGDGWATRVVAARRLGAAGDRRAAPALIAALSDKDSTVRKSAAQSLGLLTDPRAVEPLLLLLKDTDPEVQVEAQIALRAITEQDFRQDVERWREWWEQNKEALFAKAEKQGPVVTKGEERTQGRPEAPAAPAGGRAGQSSGLGLLLILALLAIGPLALLIVVRYAQRRRRPEVLRASGGRRGPRRGRRESSRTRRGPRPAGRRR